VADEGRRTKDEGLRTKTKRGLLNEGFFAFEDLEVYHQAVDLAAMVYVVTKAFPADERFALTSQLRRASTSVVLNIAEGKGRGSNKDFARFLYQARGSLLEVVSGLHLAEKLGFTQRPNTQAIYQKAKEATNKLTSFIRFLDPETTN
jgi:four helix bundle protein